MKNWLWRPSFELPRVTELFKSHKDLGRDEEKTIDLEAGRRILQEVMEDYLDPKYVPRISYLLYSQEIEQASGDSLIL